MLLLEELENLTQQPPGGMQIVSITLGKYTMAQLMIELYTTSLVKSYKGIPITVCGCQDAIHHKLGVRVSDK